MMKSNIFNKKILASAFGLALLAGVSIPSGAEAQNMQAVADFNSCQKPEWPKEALRSEQTGAVTLSFLVSDEGKVTDSVIVKSSGFPSLDEAAQRGIGRCRFRPAKINGTAVGGWTQMQYVWSIDTRERRQQAVDRAETYRAAALKGDLQALYELGMLYRGSHGLPADPAYATRMFRLAAERGQPDAQYELANILNYGVGAEKNPEQALAYYQKAAQQGNVQAQRKLAGFYETGTGVARTPTLAAEWYRKAADQGDHASEDKLGSYYENGTGVEQSDANAVSWYRKAAEADLPAAQTHLGLMYLRGKGVEKDLALARLGLERLRNGAIPGRRR
ncbi:TonB family protein [Oxalobacteraceae bacterium OTU3CINTB1]|nr:TonB family protein [Oxalobacteraceae bacterium OTU3CINTB1]